MSSPQETIVVPPPQTPKSTRTVSESWPRRVFGAIQWVPTATFLVTTVVFLVLPLTGQRALGGADLGEMGSPYRDGLGRSPHVQTSLQTDQFEVGASAGSFFRELRAGHWQLWDGEVAAGAPSGILPLNGVTSPFSLPYLVFPPWYAVGVKVALMLLSAQVFTYLLLRRLGCGVLAATLGGIAYAFCGANLALLLRISAQLVVPGALWAAHRLVDKPGLRRAGLLAAMVAWLWFEGFPSGFFYGLYLTAGWLVFLVVRAWWRERSDERANAGVLAWRRALWGGVGAAWGLVLAAVTLVPFVVEILDRGTLVGRPAVLAPLPGIQIFGLVTDRALGMAPYIGEPYWTGNNLVESGVQVGLLVALAAGIGLVVATFGRLRRSTTGRDGWTFFCAVAVLGVVLNYVGGPALDVVAKVPGIANNPVNRTRFVIDLSLVVIAALAADTWLPRVAGEPRLAEGHSQRPVGRVLSGATLVAIVGVALWFSSDYWQGLREAKQARATAKDVALAAALVLLAVALVLFARRWRSMWPLAWLGLAGILYVQLALPYAAFTPAVPVRDYYSIQPTHELLDAMLGDSSRLTASGLANFAPNSASFTGVMDLRGLTLHSAEFKDLIRAINPSAFDRDPLKILLWTDEWNLPSPLLDDLAVRYFALGTMEEPLGIVAPGADEKWSGWSEPAALGHAARTFVAPGPIQGVRLGLRAAGGDCSSASVTVSLSGAAGEQLDSATRPGFDLAAEGGWLGFALVGSGVQAKDAVTFGVTTDGDCSVEVGTVESGFSDAPQRLAAQLLVYDPKTAVRPVATEQGWIYERPSAWDLVSSHARWRGFDTSGAMLDYAGSRPRTDADVASYVKREDIPNRADSSTGERASISDLERGRSSWTFKTSGHDENLVVVSQNRSRGWHVFVDGEEADQVAVDGALLGFFVGPGDHDVRVEYRPVHFLVPAAVSLVAWVALVLVAAWPVLRRRPGQADTADRIP